MRNLPEVKTVKIASWCLVSAAIVFFVVAEVGISGHQTFMTDFIAPNRVFSSLGPSSRIASQDVTKRTTTLVGEPAYFDVRLPSFADRAEVTLSYAKDATLPDPALGVSMGGEDFVLRPFFPVDMVGEFTRAQTTVDLRGVPKKDGAYRMFVALPGVNASHRLVIHDVTIIAVRPSVKTIVADAFAGIVKKIPGL
jgi:hypothetical protein